MDTEKESGDSTVAMEQAKETGILLCRNEKGAARMPRRSVTSKQRPKKVASELGCYYLSCIIVPFPPRVKYPPG